uniref:hypothetical protein n=1 Tax=Bacillus thuringiensis TaxID=1428 RepID=UPI00202B1E8E|nr:hypothetical protein [Bacillus thuringiensis]UQM91716.1 hypothetical protein SY271_000997 [Bacillus thuringiensis]
MANQQYEENRNSLDMFRFTAVICFTSGYLIAIIFKRIGALAQVGKLEKRIVFWIAFGFSILWVLNDFQTLLASSSTQTCTRSNRKKTCAIGGCATT